MSNENITGDAGKERIKEEGESETVNKPFDLDEALSKENIEATEEDANAEQQRKEAMTERD